MEQGYLLSAKQIMAYIDWLKADPFINPSSPFGNADTAEYTNPNSFNNKMTRHDIQRAVDNVKKHPDLKRFSSNGSYALDSGRFSENLQATVDEYLKRLKGENLWSYPEVVRFARSVNAKREAKNRKIHAVNARADRYIVRYAQASSTSIHYRHLLGDDWNYSKTKFAYKSDPMPKELENGPDFDVAQARMQLDMDITNPLLKADCFKIKSGQVYYRPSCIKEQSKFNKFYRLDAYGSIAYAVSFKKTFKPLLDITVIPKKPAFEGDAKNYLLNGINTTDNISDPKKIVDYKRFIKDTVQAR